MAPLQVDRIIGTSGPSSTPVFPNKLPPTTFTLPTIQRFTTPGTSGSYIRPSNPSPLYIRVRLVGGGGAGGSLGGGGGSGSQTTFGSLTATGGTGGEPQSIGGAGLGGFGGVAYLGSALGFSVDGSQGNNGQTGTAAGINISADGPSTVFSGGGKDRWIVSLPIDALDNTGSGGGTELYALSNYSGAGSGGAGAYIEAIIPNPDEAYSFTVGSGGAGSAPGPNNSGAGGSGVIIVEEYYQ